MPDKNYAGNSGLSAVFGAIKSALNNKVDKEAGKGLSTNDYTNEEKAALAGKQDELTFDDTPTDGSNNPVKSGGVYASDEAIRKWTSAEVKTATGNPITLTDGSARKAEALSVELEPIQDLHGYDKPWAGGAGKNKIIIDETYIKSTNSSGSWNNDVYTYRGVDFTLLKDNDNNILGVDANGLSSGDWASIILSEFTLQPNTYILSGLSGGGSSTFRLSLSPSTGSDVLLFDGETSFTITSATTFILRATVRSPQVTANHVKFYPMVRLSTESDSSFAPSANICPITGYTECVVDRCGFNIWDGTIISGKIINCTNGTELVDYGYDCTDFIPVIPNTPCYFNVYSVQRANLRGMAWYDENKNYISGIPAPNNTKYGLITSPSNAKYVRCSLEKQYEDNACINISNPSKDGTYEPYQGDNVIIAFGQTVYGGSVDFKTGKVMVTHKLITLDGDAGTNYGFKNYWESSTSWTKYMGRTDRDVGNLLPSSATDINILCDSISPTSDTDRALNAPNISSSPSVAEAIYINFGSASGLDTTAKQLAWLAQNPVQVCYPLATPTELTLTPAELELLKGYNYITTNGTTIALAYLPDSLLAEAENYVDAKIPPAPSSDGTYVLTCTVTSGTPAYSWESAT